MKQGETVGLLHDFDRIDLEPWPVTAGVDGILLMQAWKAEVRRGHTLPLSDVKSDVDSPIENRSSDRQLKCMTMLFFLGVVLCVHNNRLSTTFFSISASWCLYRLA